jgi:NADH-quinone oxidoreductase subunit M
MISPSTHLVLTLAAPLVGAALAWLSGSAGRQAVRQSALVTTLVTLALAGTLVARLLASPELAAGEAAAVSTADWLVSPAPTDQRSTGALDVRLSIGLDGLSLWLFGLAALLSVTAVLVSWEAVTEKPVGFYVMLLVLEAAMLGVFAARDVILFYVFFEFTLVPLFFLIGIWGHDDRRRAAVKFFLYTLAGSVLSFLGLLTIVIWNASRTGTLSFDIATLTAGLAAHPLPMTAEGGWLQMWVFLALFAGFAVKVPIVPFHTWLPLAHVEAPTGGSVDLAGVLLKIGLYGFLRFSLPMLPEASAAAAPWLVALGVVGILYGALVALVQTDLKRLVAYSSVSHMGYCVMGLFALEPVAIEGANLQLINHGLSSAGLFAVVGMIYERYHTRSIARLGGIASSAPWLAVAFMVFTFSAVGLPGLNGFVGEFLILAGTFQRAWTAPPPALAASYLVMAVAAVTGVVLGAWYMLWAAERVLFGRSRGPAAAHGSPDAGHGTGEAQASIPDLRWHEWAAVAPLMLLVLWIGLFPGTFLRPVAPAVRQATLAGCEAFAERNGADGGDAPHSIAQRSGR